MPLSKKKIRDRNPDDIINLLYEVSKWFEGFNEDGKKVFGDDYELVTAMIGIALVSVSDNINGFFERAEEMASEMKKEKRHNERLVRGFGIKLEGDDTKNNKPS